MSSRSYFLAILLISALLPLCTASGSGRNEYLRSEGGVAVEKSEEKWEKGRMLVESSTLDYAEPGANVNRRAGSFFPPPPGKSS